MLSILKFKITKSDFLSFLLALLPLSFIAGNTIINGNILLIIISALFFYKTEIFKIQYFLLDKILIIFFILILFTGILNDIIIGIHYKELSSWKGYFSTTEKSFFFLRYLILYFVLRFLVEKENVSLKYFFITSTFFSLFVCFDIFYQAYFGKDIFGYMSSGRKLSGPFDDELIAGSYIQRFSLFAFILIPFLNLKVSNKIFTVTFLLLILFYFAGIILSGNRMPLILFLLSIGLMLLLQKEFRKFLLPFFFIFLVSFFLIYNLSTPVKNNFNNFKNQIIRMTEQVAKQDFSNKETPQHLKEFSTFYQTWLMNKYVGGGIKNFRYYCHERPKLDKNSQFICNMHPHNYYLEILTETGIIGFLLIFFTFLNVFYISFKKNFLGEKFYLDYFSLIPLKFLFLVEIFPIKSTGSFFTTGNASYLFLILPILVALSRKKHLSKNNS